ncbi:MAG: MFS transporter [Nitrososphaerota archaeon]|jgi:MFS family permease|nr:MFS transporter [Nitrososphaerota archaeon]MDG6967461.1 MFS transporter [Nitrososphaerota archaeon]MDG6978375.1 MFS transporter [Nitrososphaerota archaeon]
MRPPPRLYLRARRLAAEALEGRVTGGPSSLSFLGSTSFLALLTLGYAVYATDRTVLSAVLAPMSSALSLSGPQVGLLSAAQYIGVTCVVFAAGFLSDRLGRWPVMIAGVAVFTAFTWLIGLSTSFGEAFAFRFVSGLGEGAFWPVAMASVADHFRGRKGLALGIFYVGFDAGSVAGLSIGGVAYSLSSSWRPAFFVAPVMGLLVLAGALLLRHRLAAAGRGAGRVVLGRDALSLLRRRGVVVIMAFALLATWAGVWQVVFLPYYFYKVMHFTVLSSALLSALVTVAGGFGKVLIGGFSDYLGRNRILTLVTLATLVSYALFFFAPLGFTFELAVALAMGFFNAAIFPVTQSLMSDTAVSSAQQNGGPTGSALGLSTSTQSVATIFSPMIAASLFAFGVGRAVALDAMVPIALALMLTLFLREPRPRRDLLRG